METVIIDLWLRPMNIGNTKSWRVFSTQTDDDNPIYFVRRLNGFTPELWTKLNAKYNMEDFPSISNVVATVQLENTVFKEKVAALKRIDIPSAENVPIGYDGTSYGFSLYECRYIKPQLSWWGTGPTNWKPIIAWYTDMLEYLADITETDILNL